jgi:ABC-type glutathione transport system ATPase component
MVGAAIQPGDDADLADRVLGFVAGHNEGPYARRDRAPPARLGGTSCSTRFSSEAVTSTQAVALREVRKVYGRGDGSVVALDGVTVGLARGSFTALMGPSGSGKSTFLNVAAGRFRSANCQRRPRAWDPFPAKHER